MHYLVSDEYRRLGRNDVPTFWWNTLPLSSNADLLK
jgi:hypothetical protein